MIKKLSFWIMLCWLGAWAASAQDMQRVQKNLRRLCAADMAGRGYVKQGDRKAALFIEEQFKKLGLQTWQGTYQQVFQLPINTFPKKIKLRIDRRNLQLGKDYIVAGFSGAGKGTLTPYRIDSTLHQNDEALQAFLKTSLADKALIYTQRQEAAWKEMPPAFFKKIQEAPLRIALQPKLTAALSQQVGKAVALELLESAWPATAQKVHYEVQNEWLAAYPTQNVWGYVPGTVQPDSFLLVTAHYDHLGQMGQIYFPGANDNASGVTMLLELAAHFRQKPLPYSLLFVAFAAEEAGLVGSRHFVEKEKDFLKQIKFVLNLDLVGTGAEGIAVVNATVFPDDFALLEQAHKQEGSPFPSIQQRGEAPNSDHYFFSKNQVPAFFIYTKGGIKAYHDIYDRAETLPLSHYKELFRVLVNFLERKAKY
jgi:hypothetical protein